MTSRTPLPPELRTGPFHLRLGLELGVGRQRLAGPSWARPHSGVRVPAGLTVDPWRAYLPLLRPGQRFSHTTAALLRGAPVPSSRALEVHVSTLGRVRVRRPDVVGHNHTRPDGDLLQGIPISGPVATFIECARLLDLPDLVAIGDHLVHRPRRHEPGRPHVDVEDLRRELAERRGPRLARARAASLLLRPGAESAPESHLRLLLVMDGIPEPELGIPVRATDGRLIGWFDLGWRQPKVLVEYDGDQHRTSRDQYDRDIQRYDDAAEAGWTVIRVRAHGLYREPQETIDRVRRALARTSGGPDAV